ncbi:MAG TPA: RnfABCDGE type electron transport complex subunit D, partial [Paludibacteraceae bacterium]|nr:RnfABCDGE type electron transport complex subunit D [Paludibacteraceae bacterium]
MNNLVVSPAPHIHSGNSVPKEMKGVLIALIPAYLAALYYFCLGAFIVSITAVISCVAFEYLIQRFLLKGELTINNLSAVVTGLLLSFNLPSNLPIWIIIIGSLAAIGIGKMSFGGLGNNPFNPALIGRVFLLI